MSEECRKRFIFLNFVKLVQGSLKTFYFIFAKPRARDHAGKLSHREIYKCIQLGLKEIELLAKSHNAASRFARLFLFLAAVVWIRLVPHPVNCWLLSSSIHFDYLIDLSKSFNCTSTSAEFS